MESKKKSYDRHFKDNAVRLSYERSNQSALARELGIQPKDLYRWRSEYEEFKSASFPGKGNARLTDDQREIKRLEKELSNTKLELEILKKAVSIISKSGR